MTTCPGCDGKKTKRAQLCAGCRKRANIVGANLLAGRPTLGGAIATASTGFTSVTVQRPSTSVEPKLTDGQRRAFYAKANALDKLRRQRIGTTKKAALEHFQVESTNDLTQQQASDAIDWIESQLAEEDECT